ncbi:carboxypeptidase regulatory-like domain-containing protein, partial [Roseisolibacter sp. H3M3-2]|uniref:carboxypeptidase-like regulatory domain-containing protein n=1 Tax=Roseisolibacter sp. H3M3-2 TaxID=3031323 RepID=UPI0023DCAAC7
MRRAPLPLLLAAALLPAALLPAAARAQAVRVTLADTATGETPAHVFVSLVPADGGAAADQGLTGAGGVRLLRAPAPGRWAVLVRRVGFRPERFGPWTLAAGATVDARLALAARRVALGRVTLAEEARCGTPASRAAGVDALLAVWDALRATLETSAQGREERTVAFETRAFRRELRLNGDPGRRREEPWVAASGRPFTATVVDNRFVVGDPGWEAAWHGPDERTLLGEAFVRGHCFARVEGTGADSGMVGLRFEPARDARAARDADIAGVLWLDRASAELRRVDYRYVRLDWGRLRVPAAFTRDRLDEREPVPGGVIEFARPASGPWIVSRWTVRMPRTRREGAGGLSVVGLTEVGAEARLEGDAAPAYARAHGVAWDSLRARPLAGALVFGPGGRSVATDAEGRWTLDSLPVGAATFTVAHPALDSLGVYDVGGDGEARADGGGAPVRLASPSLATLSRELCPADPASAPPAGYGAVYGAVRGLRGGAPGEVARTALPDARGSR